MTTAELSMRQARKCGYGEESRSRNAKTVITAHMHPHALLVEMSAEATYYNLKYTATYGEKSVTCVTPNNGLFHID
jgi:hypothetical protein